MIACLSLARLRVKTLHTHSTDTDSMINLFSEEDGCNASFKCRVLYNMILQPNKRNRFNGHLISDIYLVLVHHICFSC